MSELTFYKTLLIAVYRKYPAFRTILPQAVAKLPEQALLSGIPWGHHCLLIEKIKDVPVRFWYMLIFRRLKLEYAKKLNYSCSADAHALTQISRNHCVIFLL